MSLLSGIYGKQNIVQNTSSTKEISNSDTLSREVQGKNGSVSAGDISGKMSDTSKMQPGQTISGKVVSTHGERVTIKLSDGSQMSARLEGEARLSPGQNVSFTVKGNSNSQITLSLMNTNLAQDSAAAKALNLAGLPVNENTLTMTNSMMSYGMNINGSALQNMFQQLSSYPEAAPQTIVTMAQYGLEISDTNLQSFQAFQNYESSISQGMNAIFDRGLQLYEELMNQGNSSDASKIMQSLIKSVLPLQEAQNSNLQLQNSNVDLQNIVINPGGASEPTGMGSSEQISSFSNNSAGVTEGQNNSVMNPSMNNNLSENIITDEINFGGNTSIEKLVTETNMKQSILTAGNEMLQAMNEELASHGQGKIVFSENVLGKDSYQSLPFGVRYEMVSILEKAGMSTAISAHLLSDGAAASDFLQQVQQLLEQGKDENALSSLLEHPDFKKILKNQMQDTWTVRPEDVSKATVENIYEKLHQQVKNWSEALSEAAKQDSMMGQSLSNMNQSMDFMHQMNQTYQYVQLPLKMNGTAATGDLLVYTNKRNLVHKEGDISALLHLDMANLGMVDVYAAISTNQQVTTKFYLQDDDVLDFIAAHIGQLNQRLEEKGYHIHSEVLKRKEEEGRPVIPNLPAKAIDTQTMAHYSFNALA